MEFRRPTRLTFACTMAFSKKNSSMPSSLLRTLSMSYSKDACKRMTSLPRRMVTSLGGEVL